MRGLVLLLTLMAGAPIAAIVQTYVSGTSYFRSAAPVTSPICRGANLSVRHVTEDAAMGGHSTIDYAFKNDSASPCTLMGYPRFELLDKSGRVRPQGRAINSQTGCLNKISASLN